MDNRELIILAIYVNVGTQLEVNARTRLAEMQANMQNLFEDTNKNIKIMWFPVINELQPTRVECVYPVSKISTTEPYASFAINNE